MLILDSTRKLQIVLGSAATTQLPITASWLDADSTSLWQPGTFTTASNNTTAVDVIAAPAASALRQLKFLSVYNADNVAQAVTVRVNSTATLFPVAVTTLLPGYSLIATGETWLVHDTNGAVVGNNAGPLLQGLISTATTALTTSGTTEFLIHATRVPGNAVVVGRAFHIHATGTTSAGGVLTFRIRVGAAGTVAGDTAVAWVSTTSAAQVANAHQGIDVCLIVRTLGSAGTVVCDGHAYAGAVLLPTLIGATTTAAVNTQNPWFIDVSCTCATAGTWTAQVLSVEAI